MTPLEWLERGTVLAGAMGVRRLAVSAGDWRRIAADFAAADGRLLALWADNGPDAACVRAAYACDCGALVAQLPLCIGSGIEEPLFPGLEDLFPAASRMQRALYDLNGARCTDGDRRPWLRHAAWPANFHPLSRAPPPADAEALRRDDYEFVRVEGEGVHEIPVGPVHAGIIEPGHFRFSVVGEKVLKLEERLGYTHKGIERRFAGMPLSEGQRLAARICGDSAVAFSWAYAQALEGLAATGVPPRAAWLRALCLELERIANHLGDLGALGNDAGFAFGLAQFSRLKELLLRANHEAFGQRYLMDAVTPGGMRRDLPAAAAAALLDCIAEVATEVPRLRDIYDEHAGVRDRFVGAGRVAPQLARRLGLCGLAGRASGQAFDLRVDQPCAPYGQLAPLKCTAHDGDVAARVAVRFEELVESCRLVREIIARLPGGPHRAELPVPGEGGLGIGLIEGWRGPVLLALEAGADGGIRRCHPHDPSWQNWPVLEHAIIDNIVPDFPLINKSFNLSYSGVDL